MEEPAVQQEKIEKSQEPGEDAGKAGWKNECSFSNLLKHSCFICWSSPGDTEVIEMDERVLAKAAEIRELENALAVENLELQEQQSDCKDLEETLVKFEEHKEKLIQQIKATRQLCYEESQKILSLQAEEAQKESQVEEYERELARARWRLKKLREEVKKAKRKVEEAGERDTPLQDSIRQSYEEILQEEQTLYSLSGGVVTPDSQLEESTSPADTTEDDPLPMKPWGRSQSLPAYADLIMGAGDLSFCNNLAGTREDDESGSSSTKEIDRSDIEEDQENGRDDQRQDDSAPSPTPLSQLDFYQVNLFTYGQTDNDLFNEDLFPKTDSSDGFASDPFKGSDPFAKDVFFPSANGEEENVCDEADTSLSCAENKASTGTQCFESEFPDEDSDIEISYSREDLDAIAVGDDSSGFKPIQSSSEELMPEPVKDRRCPGQCSVESDPSGYELDLCPVSSPSKMDEHQHGPGAEEASVEDAADQGSSCVSAHHRHHHHHHHSDRTMPEPEWISDKKQPVPHDLTSMLVTEEIKIDAEEARNAESSLSTLDPLKQVILQSDSEQNDLDLSYSSACPASFDPYGFKLSPENSSHTLVDPDEAELSPEQAENATIFDDEPSSPPPYELTFDPYGFDITACQIVRDSDPYGFKLSPDEENQVDLDLCDDHNLEEMVLTTHENEEELENFNYANQEVLKPQTYENQEVLEEYDYTLKEVPNYESFGNQEVLEPSLNNELLTSEQKELTDYSSYENQEVVETCPIINKEVLPEPLSYNNQEWVEPNNSGSNELQEFSYPENQEVLDLDNYGNQELLGFHETENKTTLISDVHLDEPQDLAVTENQKFENLCSHDNQETLDMFSHESAAGVKRYQGIVETDLNRSLSSNSSDSELASNNVQRPEPCSTNVSSVNSIIAASTYALQQAISSRSTTQDSRPAESPNTQMLFGADLGAVFEAGGYVACPDVADDLEPLNRCQETPPPRSAPDLVQPRRPVRPPRPSLKNKEKATSGGIDLK